MTDLMTREEDKHAAAQGWAVKDVYDLQSARWRVMILSTNPVHPYADAALAHVIGQARAGVPLAQKALKHVMDSTK